MKRIKTITSYQGMSRFYAECEQDGNDGFRIVGYLATVQTEPIRFAFCYSPSRVIARWNGKDVIVAEVSHRRYEVYEVPKEMLRFKTDDEATEWHCRFAKAV